MTQQIVGIWSKSGASFVDGTAAHNDKNSLVPAEQIQLMDSFYSDMLSEGIMLQPAIYTWNPAQSLLSIEKLVTSYSVFQSRQTYDVNVVGAAATAAGWTLVDRIITEV